MNSTMKKLLSVFLAAVLCLSMLPVSVLAAEDAEAVEETETVPDETPAEETEAPEQTELSETDELPAAVEDEPEPETPDLTEKEPLPTEELPEETEAEPETDKDPAESETPEELTAEESAEQVPAEEPTEELPETVSPAFEQTVSVSGADDISVTVRADAGVVPVGTVLFAERIESKVVENAVDKVRDDEKNVSVSYTFDVKLLLNGEEIEPAGPVSVVFTLSEQKPDVVDVDVYHVDDESNKVIEVFEELDNEAVGSDDALTEVAVVTEGFSYYVVEFTYRELRYMLEGNGTVALAELLNALGLAGEPVAAVSDAPAYFDVIDGMVTARQSFETPQKLTVTMAGGAVYEILVTDPMIIGEGSWGSLSWKLSEEGTLTISGSGAIPDEATANGPWYDACNANGITAIVIEKGITRIGNFAFSNYEYVKSVTISDSVTAIGSYAFFTCSSLKAVEIPASVKTIGEYAFIFCPAIETITVAEKNTVFRSENNCLIKRSTNELLLGCMNSTIPQGVSAIGMGAFFRAGLTELTIPGSVKVIGQSAFQECRSLTKVTLNRGLTTIERDAFNSCIALEEIAVPDTVTSIGAYAFAYCNTLGKVSLPAGLSTLSPGLFAQCDSLTWVGIPVGVTAIGNDAFRYCGSLSGVIIPDGVTRIEPRAFRECGNLTTVTIPASVTAIEKDAFVNCLNLSQVYYSGDWAQWSKITFGDGNDRLLEAERNCEVTLMGIGSCGDDMSWMMYFDGRLVITGSGTMDDVPAGDAPWYAYRKRIQSVIIEDDIKNVGQSAFYGCENLSSVQLPRGLEWIGDYAFEYCYALNEITLPDSLTVIGEYAFENCRSLRSIMIPKNVTYLGPCAFMECVNLKSVSLPAGLTAIPTYGFGNCSALTDVTVPEGVTTIENFAFSGCTALNSITIPRSLVSVGSYAFLENDALKVVYYAGGSADFTNIEIKSGNTPLTDARLSILPASGKGGAKVTWAYKDGTLTISGSGKMAEYDDVTFVPWNGYRMDVRTISIGKSVTSLCDYAFDSFERLETVTIPGNVKTVGAYAFAGCTGLKNLTIKSGVQSIGNDAFNYDFRLKTVTIPSTVTNIGFEAFYSCHGLKSVTLSGKLTRIENRTFAQCEALSGITIPASVKYIGEYAFENCCDLTNILIPAGVKEVGTGAFCGCSSLTSATIPVSITTLGYPESYCEAFYGCDNLQDVYYGGLSDQWDELSAGAGVPTSANLHFEAVKTYTVEFDYNDGSGNKARQVFVVGEEQALMPNTYERLGYQFTGWKLGKKTYADGQIVLNLSKTNGALVKLTANWKADVGYGAYNYVIHFNGNGSTGGKMADEAMKVGVAKALTKNAYTRTGYTFAGWGIFDPYALDDEYVVFANKQKVSDLNITFNGDPTVELMTVVELEAMWKANTYTVTFKGNGGKVSGGKATSYKQTLTYDSLETLSSCTFVRPGYTFLGWAKSAKAATASYADRQTGVFNMTTKNKGSVTLYAVWKANGYTIEYRSGSTDVIGSMGSQPVAYGKSVRLKANAFKYPGYTFGGWKCSNGKTYKDKASVKNLSTAGSGIVTMTAIWKPNTYTVKFAANGGTGTAPAPLKGYGGKLLPIPENTFTRNDGKSFIGWNTKKDGTGTYYYSTMSVVFDVKNKATVTLYAIWE